MSVWEIVPATAAVGWMALVANLVVIPFYGVREKWHKDYIDSGALAQAKAYIDSEKLIPSLADIVDLVIVEKKTKPRVQTATLLETVDFLPCLERAELATREKSLLDDHLTKLEQTAKKLWHWGLVHLASTIAVWAVFALFYTSSTATSVQQSVRLQSLTFLVGIVGAGLLFVLTIATICWNFWKYDQRRDAFLGSLKANR
jgi:hypothetical protein